MKDKFSWSRFMVFAACYCIDQYTRLCSKTIILATSFWQPLWTRRSRIESEGFAFRTSPRLGQGPARPRARQGSVKQPNRTSIFLVEWSRPLEAKRCSFQHKNKGRQQMTLHVFLLCAPSSGSFQVQRGEKLRGVNFFPFSKSRCLNRESRRHNWNRFHEAMTAGAALSLRTSSGCNTSENGLLARSFKGARRKSVLISG